MAVPGAAGLSVQHLLLLLLLRLSSSGLIWLQARCSACLSYRQMSHSRWRNQAAAAQQDGHENSCSLSACHEAIGSMLQPLTHKTVRQASEPALLGVTHKYIKPHFDVAYDRDSQYGRAGWEAGSKSASQAYKVQP